MSLGEVMKLEVISQKPDNPTHTTPILFVHGAWHGAWCWQETFMPYFAVAGWEVYALSLRGHGSSEGRLRWASAANYVDDVMQAAQQIGRLSIVIGHSMGGYVVQKYLEKHPSPAGVLLASIPAAGIFKFLLREMIHHPLPMLKTTLTLDPYALIGTLELTHNAFFSRDMSLEQVQSYFKRMQSESFKVIFDSLLLDLPHPKRVTTPLLVLGAANDRVFTVNEQHWTARSYGTQAEIFPDMAHDMMLEKGWQQVADRIITWLSERGL
jgi:pimeloyl-ACP methyl ester carboxylesterase